MWGSVVYDHHRELFRAWYLSYDPNERDIYDKTVIAYAESTDGYSWHKPALGLYHYKGNWDNNITIKFTPPDRITSLDGGVVLWEPDDPDPNARYKFIGFLHDERMWARHPAHLNNDVTDEEVEAAKKVSTHYLIKSPDGLHWDLESMERLSDEEGSVWSGRDIFRLTWDEKTLEYILTAGLSLNSSGIGVRTGAIRRGKTIKDMGSFCPFLLLDEDDGFGLFGQFHFPGLIFYYGNQYIGLLDYITEAGKRINIYLLSSRDGQNWDRVSRDQAFLGSADSGHWDEDYYRDSVPHTISPIPRKIWPFKFAFDGENGIVYALNLAGNPPILRDDRLFFYYTVRRASPPVQGSMQLNKTTALVNGIGLATVPRDRFAGMSSVAAEYEQDEGFLMTTPVVVDGPALYINASIDLPGGWVKVEIKDGQFDHPQLRTIEGYALEESIPVDQDGVRLPVYWQNMRRLDAWINKKVVLKFVLNQATLYSYFFE
jgi:hypothetical protein